MRIEITNEELEELLDLNMFRVKDDSNISFMITAIENNEVTTIKEITCQYDIVKSVNKVDIKELAENLWDLFPTQVTYLKLVQKYVPSVSVGRNLRVGKKANFEKKIATLLKTYTYENLYSMIAKYFEDIEKKCLQTRKDEFKYAKTSETLLNDEGTLASLLEAIKTSHTKELHNQMMDDSNF